VRVEPAKKLSRTRVTIALDVRGRDGRRATATVSRRF
jgi:hypothetical protein